MFFIALVENDEIKSSNLDGLVLKIYYGDQLPVTQERLTAAKLLHTIRLGGCFVCIRFTV